MRYLWIAAEATREGAEKLKGFGLAEGSSTPAFGRIMVVFLLLAALAWAAVWLLRRFSSRWAASASQVPVRSVTWRAVVCPAASPATWSRHRAAAC